MNQSENVYHLQLANQSTASPQDIIYLWPALGKVVLIIWMTFASDLSQSIWAYKEAPCVNH